MSQTSYWHHIIDSLGHYIKHSISSCGNSQRQMSKNSKLGEHSRKEKTGSADADSALTF